MSTPGVTLRGPKDSVARARAYTTYLPVGYCMNYVWNAIASPTHFGLADANAGWNATTDRRTDMNPPAGVPVYWAGGEHGHVAISVGSGKVRSTDFPHKGDVSEVAIADLTVKWGLTYRGWGPDYAGHPIPGLATT